MNAYRTLKWLRAVAIGLTLGTEAARAQTPVPVQPQSPPQPISVRPGRPVSPGSPGDPSGVVEPVFDIDFPGGTVVEFVAAVSAARGRPANILIDENDRSMRIPKFAMRQVTLGSLIQAINQLARMRDPASEFAAGNYAVPGETIWSLTVARPRNVPEEQVKFFNLDRFLPLNSVDDIITALNAGYQLKTGGDDRINLKFHKETRLLMVRGTPEVLAMVGDVLSQLAPPPPLPPKPGSVPGAAPKPVGQ